MDQFQQVLFVQRPHDWHNGHTATHTNRHISTHSAGSLAGPCAIDDVQCLESVTPGRRTVSGFPFHKNMSSGVTCSGMSWVSASSVARPAFTTRTSQKSSSRCTQTGGSAVVREPGIVTHDTQQCRCGAYTSVEHTPAQITQHAREQKEKSTYSDFECL